MDVHAHAHPSTGQDIKKVDPLFLGIFNVVIGCVLRIAGRVSIGT